jgi:hypothetical protein
MQESRAELQILDVHVSSLSHTRLPQLLNFDVVNRRH